jgi:hypothetical protein
MNANVDEHSTESYVVTGVTVTTCCPRDGITGVTVSSFNTLSLDPPLSGPRLADDHVTMIGSSIPIESASKDEVTGFNAEDSLSNAGIWREVRIHPFLERMEIRA